MSALVSLALAAATPAVQLTPPPAALPADAAQGFVRFGDLLIRVTQTKATDEGLDAVLEFKNAGHDTAGIMADVMHVLLTDEDGLAVEAREALALDSRRSADLSNIRPGEIRRGRLSFKLPPVHGRLTAITFTRSWGTMLKAEGASVSRLPLPPIPAADPPPIVAPPGAGAFTRIAMVELRIDAVHQAVDGSAELFITVRNPSLVDQSVGADTFEFQATGPDGKPTLSWNRTFSVRGKRAFFTYDFFLPPGGEAHLRKYFGAAATVRGPFTVGIRGRDKLPIPGPGAPAPRDPSTPAAEPVW